MLNIQAYLLTYSRLQNITVIAEYFNCSTYREYSIKRKQTKNKCREWKKTWKIKKVKTNEKFNCSY